MTYIPFFALTTRGLEFVTAEETAAVRSAVVHETGYRRVAGTIQDSPVRLLNLRTADDVYLMVDVWRETSRHRAMLPHFTEQIAQADLAPMVDMLRDFRVVRETVVFSVTASFVGKRNYTADEIKTAVAAGIETRHGWTYTPDDGDADVNVRLFIDHETAYVGVRLARHALHERAYKTAQIVGSLKPSVAAALVRLTGVERGARLLDPFCGAGTIVAEAMQMGIAAIGGDLSVEAVTAAWENVTTAPIIQWDARRLPLPDNRFDAVVSNLPWGRQIKVDQLLMLVYDQALAEMRRVLVAGGVAVLLTSAPQLLMHEGFAVAQQFEISLFGQTPTVMVLKRR